ncbi:MAG: 6,7-dimethyl-8-ribityllumazine synthase [Rickettsiales bacterium]|nr:6,7-dimethyl-8-ribityllumazine synthase [Rickettsiales bacterium]RPH01480.1 MAG: 6,7-dimethyl-8-ribityllumazine synthase [Amoebophilaceae bacterium TMED152]
MKKKYNFLIVTSNFYPKITSSLEKEATTYIKSKNYKYEIFRVQGSLEVPTKISIMLDKKKYDAVIALGCIIKGNTDHYEFISQAITNTLLSLSVSKKIPISNAILVCRNMKQALERSSKKNNRAKEAVKAAMSVLNE